MFLLTLTMVVLMGYQVAMPAVDNGKYMFQIDRDGTIIRMNTQDGAMDRCTSGFKCEQTGDQSRELDYKY